MRTPRWLRTCVLVSIGACSAPVPPAQPIINEPTVTPAPTPTPKPVFEPQAQRNGAPDPRLPVIGDPHGLLSKPVEQRPRVDPALVPRADPKKFDPGALMATGQVAPTQVTVDRDPRAVARVEAELARRQPPRPVTSNPSAPIQDKTVGELLRSVQTGAARPHVVYLYAAYCGACRSVMPAFLDMVRSYQQRGVQFSAASVDRDRDAFAQYAPVLGGALPAIWLRSEGNMRDELARAGIEVSATGFAIPLFALFDKGRKLYAQGHSRELHKLPATLDKLL